MKRSIRRKKKTSPSCDDPDPVDTSGGDDVDDKIVKKPKASDGKAHGSQLKEGDKMNDRYEPNEVHNLAAYCQSKQGSVLKDVLTTNNKHVRFVLSGWGNDNHVPRSRSALKSFLTKHRYPKFDKITKERVIDKKTGKPMWCLQEIEVKNEIYELLKKLPWDGPVENVDDEDTDSEDAKVSVTSEESYRKLWKQARQRIKDEEPHATAQLVKVSLPVMSTSLMTRMYGSLEVQKKNMQPVVNLPKVTVQQLKAQAEVNNNRNQDVAISFSESEEDDGTIDTILESIKSPMNTEEDELQVDEVNMNLSEDIPLEPVVNLLSDEELDDSRNNNNNVNSNEELFDSLLTTKSNNNVHSKGKGKKNPGKGKALVKKSKVVPVPVVPQVPVQLSDSREEMLNDAPKSTSHVISDCNEPIKTKKSSPHASKKEVKTAKGATKNVSNKGNKNTKTLTKKGKIAPPKVTAKKENSTEVEGENIENLFDPVEITPLKVYPEDPVERPLTSRWFCCSVLIDIIDNMSVFESEDDPNEIPVLETEMSPVASQSDLDGNMSMFVCCSVVTDIIDKMSVFGSNDDPGENPVGDPVDDHVVDTDMSAVAPHSDSDEEMSHPARKGRAHVFSDSDDSMESSAGKKVSKRLTKTNAEMLEELQKCKPKGRLQSDKSKKAVKRTSSPVKTPSTQSKIARKKSAKTDNSKNLPVVASKAVKKKIVVNTKPAVPKTVKRKSTFRKNISSKKDTLIVKLHFKKERKEEKLKEERLQKQKVALDQVQETKAVKKPVDEKTSKSLQGFKIPKHKPSKPKNLEEVNMFSFAPPKFGQFEGPSSSKVFTGKKRNSTEKSVSKDSVQSHGRKPNTNISKDDEEQKLQKKKKKEKKSKDREDSNSSTERKPKKLKKSKEHKKEKTTNKSKSDPNDSNDEVEKKNCTWCDNSPTNPCRCKQDEYGMHAGTECTD